MKAMLFKNFPYMWVPSSYFTMALTSMVLTSSTAIMFKNFGWGNAQAAQLSSLLLFVYTIKPLFSPVVEIYKTKKFFVLRAQTVIGVGFICAAMILSLQNSTAILIALLVVISFFGATQDIACDGVYVTSLSPKAQSFYCGVQSLSWNIGPIVASGGLVYLSGWLYGNYFHLEGAPAGAGWIESWRVVFLIVGIAVLIMATWHSIVMPDGAISENRQQSVKGAINVVRESLSTFIQKPNVWTMIAFAFFFRSSVGLLEKTGPFFMVDPVAQGGLGLSNELLGIIHGTYGLGAFLVGSLIGGVFVTRVGLRPTVLLSLSCAVNLPGVTFLLMSIYQPASLPLIALGVVVEKFFFGFGSVGYMIYLMQQMAPGKYPTTHYAFGTALLALSMMVTGVISGYLQQTMGYVKFFSFVMLATIPSFLFTWLAPFNHRHDEILTDKKSGENATMALTQ